VAVGPGAAREAEVLERAFPGATAARWRFEGLSALDLAAAARSERGPLAGLPAPGRALEPVYVRPPQAEQRVRQAALARDPLAIRPMHTDDLPAILVIEQRVFADAWPESFFRGELEQPWTYARVAERAGAIAGYMVAWLGAGVGHVGNLAVSPDARRRGVATALLGALFEEARRRGVQSVALEVRVSNFAAQALYRAHGFRLAGLRRGYYRDRNEDALVMEWRGTAVGDARPARAGRGAGAGRGAPAAASGRRPARRRG
jgi:[ribosomal protein S18]-alanine N-acetyltransferase